MNEELLPMAVVETKKPPAPEPGTVKCPECGSESMHELGLDLQCQDCRRVWKIGRPAKEGRTNR